MRVAFFGTPAYAVPTLDALIQAGHDVVTVVAQPDQRRGRGKKLQSPATVQRARELGIGTRQPRGVRSGPFPKNYGALDLDVAVVVAYGRILPQAILDVPRLGSINGHGSLLPRWRGAGPIQWALRSGDAETGVCTMQMDAGLDTGDVLLTARTPIDPDEDCVELAERLSHLTAELCVETLAQLETLTPTPQPDQGVTHARMFTKDDAALDLSLSARAVHDIVRAQQPWPGAQAPFRGQPLKLKKTRVVDASGPVGQVLEVRKRLVVACGSGALEILAGQLPGKPARSGRDLANGARIEVGERLG